MADFFNRIGQKQPLRLDNKSVFFWDVDDVLEMAEQKEACRDSRRAPAFLAVAAQSIINAVWIIRGLES